MNIKRIFGALLTVLGITGLIYAAIVFINSSGGTRTVKTLVIYGILGLIFSLPESAWYVRQKMSHNM